MGCITQVSNMLCSSSCMQSFIFPTERKRNILPPFTYHCFSQFFLHIFYSWCTFGANIFLSAWNKKNLKGVEGQTYDDWSFSSLFQFIFHINSVGKFTTGVVAPAGNFCIILRIKHNGYFERITIQKQLKEIIYSFFKNWTSFRRVTHSSEASLRPLGGFLRPTKINWA